MVTAPISFTFDIRQVTVSSFDGFILYMHEDGFLVDTKRFPKYANETTNALAYKFALEDAQAAGVQWLDDMGVFG